jgi:8-hydroxy-5-deazaflavin:NADPH oxidoreductase
MRIVPDTVAGGPAMKIAIIGTGNVGKALGTTFARVGNYVIFAATSPDSSRKAAEGLGAKFAATVREAAERAEIVVIAVPYVTAGRQVATEMAAEVVGKVVIDATNPIGADGSLATAGGPSAAEHFAEWLPGAHVVKAFNTLFARVQADPKTHGAVIDALFATDDPGARAKVGTLLRSIGFRPIYVGPLARARELEAMAHLNIQLQMSAEGDWSTSFTLVGVPKLAIDHKDEPRPPGVERRVRERRTADRRTHDRRRNWPQ